jgi:hypothetical protein
MGACQTLKTRFGNIQDHTGCEVNAKVFTVFPRSLFVSEALIMETEDRMYRTQRMRDLHKAHDVSSVSADSGVSYHMPMTMHVQNLHYIFPGVKGGVL